MGAPAWHSQAPAMADTIDALASAIYAKAARRAVSRLGLDLSVPRCRDGTVVCGSQHYAQHHIAPVAALAAIRMQSPYARGLRWSRLPSAAAWAGGGAMRDRIRPLVAAADAPAATAAEQATGLWRTAPRKQL